ncbi:hypothetical protein [Flavobacterium foetidum]|uniref:hypothetical protein n=1 Tax=Flavobacterium foetidum TaxID=2026681 RepID=UPI001075041E|nr:hypothetical protein [Flavobacterium foetidum]KAF2514346.1 hypothetical protein E0W73_13180 [Flavobacterium foetidum]
MNRIKFAKKILIISLIIILVGCEEKKKDTFYDKVLYYHSNTYMIPGPPDNTQKHEIYFFHFAHKTNVEAYSNLSKFGYAECKISPEFALKIDDFFTSTAPPTKMVDPRCLNCYQDIMLFYKKDELIGIAKFDFKCNKYCYTNFLQNKKIFLKRDCGKYKYLFKK